jgi:O-antigen ligase
MLDRAHHAARPAEQAEYCVPISIEEPYRHRLTLYALALRTALEAYRAHPFLGLGHHGYREFALAYAQRSYGLGTTGYYWDPIGLYASALAQGGSVGAWGIALLLLGVWRARPRAEPPVSERGDEGVGQRWLFYGTAALLLCALQTDLELRGTLWLLLGFLVGQGQQA